MGPRIATALAILAIVVGVLQYTPLHFLSKDATDFVWGLVVGLGIGAIIAWIATRS